MSKCDQRTSYLLNVSREAIGHAQDFIQAQGKDVSNKFEQDIGNRIKFLHVDCIHWAIVSIAHFLFHQVSILKSKLPYSNSIISLRKKDIRTHKEREKERELAEKDHNFRRIRAFAFVTLALWGVGSDYFVFASLSFAKDNENLII